MSRKFIIVGGGIGGLAAGLALHRAGLDFDLYERSPAFTDIGAGLSLWPNATRVLGSLGVLDTLLGLGQRFTHFNLMKPDGGNISSIAMDVFQAPSLCIHRADLHRSLRETLPFSCLMADQRLVSFSQNEEGVTAAFAGGLTASADGLIGADGINSTVRAKLHGASGPVYRGYRIWRGIAPSVAGVVHGRISETWGSGRRFGIMPMGQGRICWYATHNCEHSRPDVLEDRREALISLFRGWHTPIQALIEATQPADIVKADAQDRGSLRIWGRHRVTLLGDAAHPITPNVGQGACLAIEDAVCLAKFLHQAPDVAGAFRAYESMRSSRTAAIGRQARRIGFVGQLENPWMVRARNVTARVLLSMSPDVRFNAVYAHVA